MSLDTVREWTTESELGLGTFSKVFSAVEPNTGQPVVIKYPLHTKGPSASMLEKEAKTMRHLLACKGIPKLIDASHCPEYIVMERVGRTLLALREEGKAATSKTVIMVGLRVLDVIEELHNAGYIHVDIKPDNIATSLDLSDPTIFLIDLGLSRKHTNSGIHIAYSETEEFVGTPYFASLNSIRGVKPARRDDLEALGYVLLFLLRGSLPWIQAKPGVGTMELLRQVQVLREKYSAKSLCLPTEPELWEFIAACQGYGFAEKPNYEALRTLLNQWAERTEAEIDWNYDWKPQISKGKTAATAHLSKAKHCKRRLTGIRVSPSKNMSSLEEISPSTSPGQKIEALRRCITLLQDTSSTEEGTPELVKTPVHGVSQLPSFSIRPRVICPILIEEAEAPKTAVLPTIQESGVQQSSKRQRRYTCDEFSMTGGS